LAFLDGKGPIANKEGIAYYNRLIDALLENGTSLSSLLPNI
jgi:beta-glucosidase/6-phospho-beta-glucosidase/beta-galactosidase